MQSFISYLVEETSEEKLSHLEHGEDHLINAGDAGFNHALETLRGTHNLLSGEKSGVTLSTKYDGSPSVVFGHNPENGRFFVASKSIFNKEPKINYTDEDIDRNHGHAPGLAKKLKEALKHLKTVAPEKGVFQGDFMYSADDVKKHGRNYKFTPNTITYTADQDSATGQRIKNAKIGFVVHTAYKGNTLQDMKATFNPSLTSFKKSNDVHLIKPTVDLDRVNYNPKDQTEFVNHMNRAIAEYSNGGRENLSALQNSRLNFKTYINSTVRNNTTPTPQGFTEFLKNSQKKDVESVKTDKAKAEKKKKWDDIINNSIKNKNQFASVIEMHRHLQNAKNVLVRALSTSPEFGHEINGKPTDPEGFVASLNNRPTKLVNRAEFSAANFTKNRDRTPTTEKLSSEPDNKITLKSPEMTSKEPVEKKQKPKVSAKTIGNIGKTVSAMSKKEYKITPQTTNQALGVLKKRNDTLGIQAKAELNRRQRLSRVK